MSFNTFRFILCNVTYLTFNLLMQVAVFVIQLANFVLKARFFIEITSRLYYGRIIRGFSIIVVNLFFILVLYISFIWVSYYVVCVVTIGLKNNCCAMYLLKN